MMNSYNKVFAETIGYNVIRFRGVHLLAEILYILAILKPTLLLEKSLNCIKIIVLRQIKTRILIQCKATDFSGFQCLLGQTLVESLSFRE